ncbi:MAG: type II secretion system protein GspM [Alphaproteobacteria bacterium]|nr:type II secretion system protein GspM [Alphaproteobacteria bacterium]
MSRPLPPLVSRLLALLILAGICGLAWLGAVQPLLGLFTDYRDSVVLAEEQLPRLRRLAAMAPSLKAELARIERDPSARTRQLSGGSDALAAADLQNRLGRISAANGIVLRSTQILPAEEEEGFRRIGVRVALEGGVGALLKILHGLETAPTMLFIDNLEIRARSGGRVRRNPNAAVAETEEILLIRFDLAGYIVGTKP